jgi:predicted chitinase
VKTAILENEYTKVGGKENYDLIQQAQKMDIADANGQFAQQMKSMKEYIATK